MSDRSLRKRNAEIWALRESGWTQSELSQRYGVSRARINQIINRLKSRHLITARLANCLKNAGFGPDVLWTEEHDYNLTTWKIIYNIDPNSMLKTKNMGRKTMSELDEVLGKLGFVDYLKTKVRCKKCGQLLREGDSK